MRIGATLLTLVLSALLIAPGCSTEDDGTGTGVGIGSTVADCDKHFGPPVAVIPNFGTELRTYEGKSGEKYMITIKDGEVIEIN